MNHLHSFIKYLLSMYYAPGTELAPVDIDTEKTTLAPGSLQSKWNSTETITILHEKCNDRGYREHRGTPYSMYVRWIHQISIYCYSVPNPFLNACSVITEIWGTPDIFTILIILIYKYIIFFYLLSSFIPFPFYSFFV